MPNNHKFRLMIAALKRINCDVLRAQYALYRGDFMLAAYSYDLNRSFRLFAKIYGNRHALSLNDIGLSQNDFSNVLHDDGIVIPNDYWKVFEKLIALKKPICTANGTTMLSGDEDDIYQLEIEADLQGDN